MKTRGRRLRGKESELAPDARAKFTHAGDARAHGPRALLAAAVIFPPSPIDSGARAFGKWWSNKQRHSAGQRSIDCNLDKPTCGATAAAGSVSTPPACVRAHFVLP